MTPRFNGSSIVSSLEIGSIAIPSTSTFHTQGWLERLDPQPFRESRTVAVTASTFRLCGTGRTLRFTPAS